MNKGLYMGYYLVLRGIEERAIMKVLETSEIRLFGLMAERLFLAPIGYGNELKYGYLRGGGVKKTPA